MKSKYLVDREIEPLRIISPPSNDRINVTCPIDGTPLAINSVQYNGVFFQCYSCGALYTNLEDLKEEAENYIASIKKRLETGMAQLKDVPKLESIINTVKE